MKWYTTQEAAEKLGLSDSHVRRLISGTGLNKPKLRAKRVGGKVWMISEQVINTYLKRKKG